MRLGDLLTIIALVLTFDLAIPGIGVFVTHFYWGNFRRRILHLWQSESLRYEHIGEHIEEADYRFLGSYDGTDDTGSIYLRNEGLSVLVDPNKTDLYLLPEGEGLLRLERIDQKDIQALGDVVKIFAGGPVTVAGGRLVFCLREKRKPVLLLYTGSERLMFARAASAGHRVHPYLNKFTPFSIGLGTFLLLLLTLGFLQEPGMGQSVRLGLSAMLIPVYPILPPGILALFLYTTFSRKAHQLRLQAEEAIESHGGNPWQGAELIQYQRLNKKASILQILGVVMIIVAVGINAVIYHQLLGLIPLG